MQGDDPEGRSKILLLKDRREAGRKLAELLDAYRGEDIIVYALPRGGVVLGAEIAKVLKAPLDLIIPRKIGHPMNPEYAICAVTEFGPPVCNEEEVERVDRSWLREEITRARAEIQRRREKYLGTKIQRPPERKTCIIVDDGIATGLTVTAAIDGLKTLKPKKVIVAIPVIPSGVAQKLKTKVDELISLSVEECFLGSVSAYYEEFSQVDDLEVIELLRSVGDSRNEGNG